MPAVVKLRAHISALKSERVYVLENANIRSWELIMNTNPPIAPMPLRFVPLEQYAIDFERIVSTRDMLHLIVEMCWRYVMHEIIGIQMLRVTILLFISILKIFMKNTLGFFMTIRVDIWRLDNSDIYSTPHVDINPF